MNRNNIKLRAGDWVEVEDRPKIAETLDSEGTLHGLPLMPEMLNYCGQRLRVARIAKKCRVEYSNRFRIHRFRGTDVVILDGLRCSVLMVGTLGARQVVLELDK